MTVRVTTLKGPDAGAYYVEALPNYYLQVDEPGGRWMGRAALPLALSGDVVDDDFLTLMAGRDPRHPNRDLGRRFGDDSARGYDVTCSAPKSVSVLFGLGVPAIEQQVLAAQDAAVRALAGWIDRHAHTRFRIGGEVATVDAHGIVAAAFRQHTSRALDPQIHTHLVIANRVAAPDGRWLALDARLIKHDQRTLSAIYHAALRSELTRRLGVGWHQPEHGIAEIADVPDDVLAEFSSRTHDVRRRLDDKLDRFTDTMGRDPTPRERWRLEREAVVDSRPSKASDVDAATLRTEWAARACTLGHEPAALVRGALSRVRPRPTIDITSARATVDRAMATMADTQSTWRPTELHREIAAALPTDIALDAERLTSWIDRVADATAAKRCIDLTPPAPAGALLRRDGRPVNESVLDRALTTQAILDQEAELLAWADRRLLHDGAEHPVAARRSRRPLTVAQVHTAAAVAGDRDLVLVVGPAGTGKTAALAPAVAQLRADGRAVFGVAPSATAAEVLAIETGVAADTLDKLLIEHRLDRPPSRPYDLPVGATVIVDEAGMTSTAKLAELADLADARGWRIALVGDPMQFSAVGRGGMFGLLVETFGAIELERVHRFAAEWERDASLRLRRGDVDVAAVYDDHGRLHGGTPARMERAVVDRWWELRQQGSATLLMAPTNEAVERLNTRCQQLRLDAGEIAPNTASIVAGRYRLHVGDDIATRHNDRTLVTDTGDTVRNRATWTITDIGPDGYLVATGRNGTVRLPDAYVAAHVELAYACTATATQGRTVRAGLLFSDGATDVRNLYVAMTRGTDTNEAYLTTTGEETAADLFGRAITTDWIDHPAHVRRSELSAAGVARRPGLLDGTRLRELVDLRHELAVASAQPERDRRRVQSEYRKVAAEREHAVDVIASTTAEIERARAMLDRYDRPLRRAKHEPEISNAKYQFAILPQMIEQARAGVASLEKRAAQLDNARFATIDAARRTRHLGAKVTVISAELDADLRVRARVARLERPAGVVEVLGDRPASGAAATDWDHAAARLLQHQAAFGIARGLGPQPGYFDETAYAISRAAVAEAAGRLPHLPEPRGRPVPELGL